MAVLLQVQSENIGEVILLKWSTGSASGSDASRVGCVFGSIDSFTIGFSPPSADFNRSQMGKVLFPRLSSQSAYLQVRLLPKK